MKTYYDYRRLRESETAKLDDALNKLIQTIQGALYAQFASIVDDLLTDEDGKISTTVRNVTAPNRIGVRIQTETKTQAPRLISRIVRGLLRVLGLNRFYFRSMPDLKSESIDDRVLRKVMLRYGYDTTRNAIIPGGWLDQLSDNQALTQRVTSDIRQAMAAKTPLNEFKKQFRDAFTGKNGLGYLQQHYNTFVFDLHQQFDRQTQLEYADQLKLNHALYSGTIKDNTRPFCEQRTGQVYTREFIAKWENLEFQGKLRVGYNPFVHCGGYNCRHHLNWVSPLIAERIAKGKENINTYK